VLSSWTNPHLLSLNGKQVTQQGNFMQPDAAEMLTLNMRKGSRAGLQDPASILLSASLSAHLFGEADPIGHLVQLDSIPVKVTGVYEDLPANTTFSNVSFIAPWALYVSSEPEVKDNVGNWGANSYQLLAQINPNSEMNTGGDIRYIWLFGTIGVFVLLLACINFMNLSTARATRRAKEVGIRKALGSFRSQLVMQFFSESILTTLLAFVFTLLLVQLSLPVFNQIADKKIQLPWGDVRFWLAGIAFSIFTGIIAGSYPAFYLSAFRPVKVLKGVTSAGRNAVLPRKVLVVLQFTVSVILIIGAAVVFRQIRFTRDRPVGYTRDGLVMIRPYSDQLHVHFDAMYRDLLQTGAVTAMAESSNTITRGSRSSGGFSWEGKTPGKADDFTTVGVSSGYGKAVRWQFVAGRDFSATLATDSAGLILNEAAVQFMGLKDPVGKMITWEDRNYMVLGVTTDIIMESPYERVKQAVYFLMNQPGVVNLRINPLMSMTRALQEIATVYSRYAPGAPFEYKFADEEYARKFSNEEQIGRLAAILAVLAIVISCLGLFGMAAFMAEQRTKEIGIRRVLGATVLSVWQLLSKEFVILVTVSFLVAAPLAYFGLQQWLQHYSYRTTIPWWIFAITGAGALLLTLLTVSLQIIKATMVNPVKSLRSE